ncbi:MAG TPA: glycosyltransferase [Planctomycetota bacterium]|nr:glycosyltransferase [Planctomycetota bacterium]
MLRRLLFIVPWFLYPASTGGRIRTLQILRGLKGGAFSVTLASPVTRGGAERFGEELKSVCDRFVSWPSRRGSRWRRFLRIVHLAGLLPMAVECDRSVKGARVIGEEIEARPDLVVVDFPHAAVLLPPRLDVPSVLFTHNVESEIYRRQVEAAENPIFRHIWRDQMEKMERYERETLGRFDRVIAVSDRDAKQFRERYGTKDVVSIPTGVDLDYFSFVPPAAGPCVIFSGSMDWQPNAEGVEWLLRDVWPAVAKRIPQASLKIIGRDPPAHLVRSARGMNVEFTGFVDDVRPHMRGAAASVIPLHIGGGTRIKAYEAMAQGIPIVSTTIGMEGLPAEAGRHYLLADDPQEFAGAIVQLLTDHGRCTGMATAARQFVEASFSSARVAAEFERICLGVLNGRA